MITLELAGAILYSYRSVASPSESLGDIVTRFVPSLTQGTRTGPTPIKEKSCQTFRDEDCVRVHPIITKGGDLVNIVPAEVCLETYVRARTPEAILDAAGKVDRALRGAAIAMGCRVEIETVPGNLPLRNDPLLAEIFRNRAGEVLGEEGYRDYAHSGGSTDAGDLSQLIPVLHPMMTGGSGAHHQTDWCIANFDAGYVSPAKTLALMALDLLLDDAQKAREVLSNYVPAMTKDEYLSRQKSIFREECFDGTL